MIKVESEMVSNIEKNPTDQYMLEAVTGFARKMHIEVCIGGVETESAKNCFSLYAYILAAEDRRYRSIPRRAKCCRTLWITLKNIHSLQLEFQVML